MSITIVIGFIFLGSILTLWWKNGREILMICKLPGPSIIEYIKIAFSLSFGDRNSVFAISSKWYKEYGSVVGGWYGYMAVVWLRDPEHIEKIVSHDPLCRRMPDFLHAKMMFPFKGGILEIEGNRWKSRRKTLNNAFHFNILETHLEDFERNSQILTERLKELADGSFHRLDIMLAQCAMDIVIQASFGFNLDIQKRNDVDIIENTMKVVDFQMQRIIKPWLFNDWIFKRSTECRKIEEVNAFFAKYIMEGIKVKEHYYKVLKKQDNKLDYLLYMVENLSTDDVIGEVKCFAGAGTETAATTCCFALALLSEHQDIQEKVLEEQKKLLGENIYRPVAKDDLEYMPYLEQVLKETLRLYPPLPFLFRTTKDDVDIGDGHILPKGTLAVINVFENHRMSKYYPNPEKFDPERFSPDNSINRHPFSFIPFGLGRRICIGKKYAMMEMKIIMSTIIRRFHFLEVKGGMKGLMDSLQVGLILHPTSRFYFKFQLR